ncbi:MAG: ATP-binding protein [Sulfuricurvum sp.]
MAIPDLADLKTALKPLLGEKESIVQEWVRQELCTTILIRHEIDTEYFASFYAEKVFDYFLGVISGVMQIGQCPVIAELIDYLKDKELRADELFILCTHFKRSVINATYRLGINTPEIFNAVSYLFDQNFASVLKLYTDTIYEKEQEAINASKAKEYFLSNMSHEIRTPLNAILGFVALLRDEAVNPRYQKYLEIVSNSGESLLQIIGDILDFSKLRSGEFTVDPHTFNLHDEISHTMELYVPSANSKSITLISFIDPSMPYEMIADPLRIKQILGNFLSNAIKFSDPFGAIHVEAKYGDGLLSLSVSDQGIGIDPADQERIFDAFSQTYEGMTRISGGTGLGLSICKQLAEHMGGSIELHSSIGSGSTFTLKIPVEVNLECALTKFDVSAVEGLKFALLQYDPDEGYKLDSLQRYWEHFGLEVELIDNLEHDYDLLIFLESSIDDERREWIISKRVPSIAILDFLDDRYDTISSIVPLTFPIYCTKLQGALNELMGQKEAYCLETMGTDGKIGYKGSVLVAEDNEANQELIKILLERCGLEYTIVSNGKEAVESFSTGSFDIVLMDEQMPVMNGNEATRLIRTYEAQNGLNHTPIIAVTANVIKGSRERSIQNGYDMFLGKPIVLKEIEQVFERHLEKIYMAERPTSAESLSRHDLKVDMAQLKAALMLDEEQIEHLLRVYCSKMDKSLQELESAIRKMHYAAIARIAHSIKGSSANFRFEELSRIASVIEESATQHEHEFDFSEAFDVLKKEYVKHFGE